MPSLTAFLSRNSGSTLTIPLVGSINIYKTLLNKINIKFLKFF